MCNSKSTSTKQGPKNKIRLMPLDFDNDSMKTTKELIKKEGLILTQEMNKTKKNVKEALFQLSRLVEDESTLHKVIRGGNPGLADVFDL